MELLPEEKCLKGWSRTLKGEDMKKGLERVNKATFIPPAILCLAIVVVGALIPEKLGDTMNFLLNVCTTYGGWFYALGTVLLVIFCIWVAFSKYGKIKFGGKDAEPEMSTWKWFCIVLTSGMAAGICYWCIAEPMNFYLAPPVFSGNEGGTAAAAEGALRYVLTHWTLHPYAVYTAAAIGIAFMYWNCRKPFSISSALYPLIGEKATGNLRYWINALCIFCLVAGLGTTLGLAIDQLTVGIQFVFGVSISKNLLAFFVCIGFAVIATLVACSGLHKGVGMVSTINMYIFIFLMIFAFLFGGTLFILNNTVTAIGQYLQNIIAQSFYLEPAHQSGWINGWTIFYWAWWVAFAPLIGLFQVKLSKGRTVREYVIVNMFVPSIFLTAWMGIFGSSAINMHFNQGITSVADAINEWGSSVAFYAYLKEMPLSVIIIPIAMLAIIFSIVTQTEAEVLTISDLCVASDEELAKSDNLAPAPLKLFWGFTMSLLAFVLLISGGLSAVQTASIVLGLPMMLLILLMAVGTIKGLKNYKKYDQTLREGEDYE